VWKWQTCNLRQLRFGEEKKKEEEERKKEKPQDENIMVFPIPQGDRNEQVFMPLNCNCIKLANFEDF